MTETQPAGGDAAHGSHEGQGAAPNRAEPQDATASGDGWSGQDGSRPRASPQAAAPAAARPRSAILPYRGAGEEPRMLRDFVRAVVQGGVDELVVGVDRGVGEYPELEEECARHPDRVRAVTVPPSPDWGFRFAAVVWHLIQDARHDLVLVANVDELPGPAALEPPRRAGIAPGYVLESGPTASDGPLEIPVWTGTFWVWRPALAGYLDPKLYRRIRDGGDSFFFWSAVRAGLRYHLRQGPWITVRGESHDKIGWYQWKNGLRESARAQRAWSEIAVHRRAARNFVAIRGMWEQREWWRLRGWLAGLARPNSYWAAQARALDDTDWLHQGRLPYDDLWKRWWKRAPSSEAVVAHGRGTVL